MNKKTLITGALITIANSPSFERLEIREDECKLGNEPLNPYFHKARGRSKADRKRQPRWPRR